MRSSGLARGGSLDNAVVVHEGSVLNDDGLRGDDEFVRHKTLDCLGDLYLLGMAVRAKLTTSRPSHALSTKLLQAVMARPDCFVIENKAKQTIHGGLHGPILKRLWLHIPEQNISLSDLSSD